MALITAATCASVIGSAAQADFATIPAVRNVMTGNSSSGNDQVWFRVNGVPSGVPASCTGSGMGIFYLATDGSIDVHKGMSLLISAQLSGKPIQIAYDIAASSSDFWYWGISNCRVTRIVIGD
jgi:hypothetical protein